MQLARSHTPLRQLYDQVLVRQRRPPFFFETRRKEGDKEDDSTSGSAGGVDKGKRPAAAEASQRDAQGAEVPSEELIAKVEKWEKEDGTAQHIVLSGLHNKIYNGLRPFSTAQKLLEHLLTTYGVITKDQVVSS